MKKFTFGNAKFDTRYMNKYYNRDYNRECRESRATSTHTI